MTVLRKKSVAGFSLLELLVAATIIGLLASIGLVSYTSANRRARDANRQSDLEQVRTALELYRSENPTYPASGWANLTVLDPYVSGGISQIADPKASPYPQYIYETSGTEFTAANCTTYVLCADTESDPAASYDYCVCNP